MNACIYAQECMHVRKRACLSAYQDKKNGALQVPRAQRPCIRLHRCVIGLISVQHLYIIYLRLCVCVCL